MKRSQLRTLKGPGLQERGADSVALDVEGVRTVDDFYRRLETISEIDRRLEIFMAEYERFRSALGRPLRVLDIGCGRKALLAKSVVAPDEYWACDITPPDADANVERFVRVDLNVDRLPEKFGGRRFDVIFCGEVIEHIFNPDALMGDLKTLLADDGLLILSTPNLAYWRNRLVLLFGISPFFLENSSLAKLGRRFRFFGQGNGTEGHLKVFTYRAMLDFLRMHGMQLRRVKPVHLWPFLTDRIIAAISPSLSPDIIYFIQKS